MQAPAVTAVPTPAPTLMTDTYVLGSAIAIIVAKAIVGAVLALLVRKRP
jgi:predicted cobalt transporter CbtA